MADTFSDNNETGWTEHNGSWNTVATSPNGYAYQQTNTTQSTTNASYNLTQDSPISYNWQMTFQSSNRKAGLYFFGSDAANNSYHGNSYRIWQNESQLQICEQTPNSSNCSASANLSAANGETHTYRATYNPANGQISVWRDGVFALTWTDSTPLTSGNHIAFRTQNSSVRFDNIRVTTTTSSLYYFFTDHLGSTSVLSDSSGNEVAGSRTRHLPFGGWRGTAPTQTVTDRAFTGQKENMEVGLLYFNARYYLPNTNRMISPDTIVPNPANPQSFNRYSYARNNPINFTDPTGHRECGVGDDCDGGVNLPQRTPYTRMVSFSGEGWTSEEIAVVIAGARAVANMLYEVGGGQFASDQEAFLAVFGGTVNFYKPGTSSEYGNLGWRENKNSIWVYEHNSATVISEGVRWVAHELGHSFDSALHPNTVDHRDYGQGTIDLATSDIGYTDAAGVYTPLAGGCNTGNYLTTSCYESSGDGFISRDNASGTPMEDFPDMFSGYVFGFADNAAGDARYNWMNSQMSAWINLAVTNNNNR